MRFRRSSSFWSMLAPISARFEGRCGSEKRTPPRAASRDLFLRRAAARSRSSVNCSSRGCPKDAVSETPRLLRVAAYLLESVQDEIEPDLEATRLAVRPFRPMLLRGKVVLSVTPRPSLSLARA